MASVICWFCKLLWNSIQSSDFSKLSHDLKRFFWHSCSPEESGRETMWLPTKWRGVYIKQRFLFFFNICIQIASNAMYADKERQIEGQRFWEVEHSGTPNLDFCRGVHKALRSPRGWRSQFCGWNVFAEALRVGYLVRTCANMPYTAKHRAKFCEHTTSSKAYLRCWPRGLIRIVSQLCW